MHSLDDIWIIMLKWGPISQSCTFIVYYSLETYLKEATSACAALYLRCTENHRPEPFPHFVKSKQNRPPPCPSSPWEVPIRKGGVILRPSNRIQSQNRYFLSSYANSYYHKYPCKIWDIWAKSTLSFCMIIWMFGLCCIYHFLHKFPLSTFAREHHWLWLIYMFCPNRMKIFTF